jgi:hypothetical protein
MCLKAIAFTLALEMNNKMIASQRNIFSRLVRDQNLRSRLIFHLRQTPVKRGFEDAPRSRLLTRWGIEFSASIAAHIIEQEIHGRKYHWEACLGRTYRLASKCCLSEMVCGRIGRAAILEIDAGTTRRNLGASA